MNKIPVWNTIRFAYTFTFGDIGTIIGLIWLPTVLIAVLQFLPYALGMQPGARSEQPSQAIALIYLMCFGASWVLYAMNAVSVTGRALGQRTAGTSIHFSLGRPEWRVFGAFMLCGVVLVTFYVAYLLGFWLLAHTALGSSLVVQLLFSTGWLCVLVYSLLRFGFLLPPLVIVEDSVDLSRAWGLATGNFWRIFAIVLAVTLPLALVQFGAMLAIVGTQIVVPVSPDRESMEAVVSASVAVLDKHMPELIGLSLLLAPFSVGLLFGASAAAYRSLVPSRQGRTQPVA